VISLLFMTHADYDTLQAWIAQPSVTVLLLAFLFSLFYHAILGMQVVIEDYVHQEGAKFASLLVMKFLLILLGGSAVIAVLRIAFGG
jgi:succinate dehydrogenase / fumarate reductase membrane anchor subunit